MAIPGEVASKPKAALPPGCPAYTPQDAKPLKYLTAREDCWNAACKEWPALIAQPTTVAEVQAAIKFANGKKVAVLSGGHSQMCMPKDAFVINLRKMNNVSVNVGAGTVTAQGGAKVGEVDVACAPYNVFAPLGTHPDTGIGGFTLGGGVGWMCRRVGLTVDNLVEAQVVLANGTLVTASTTSEPELFWAIRGGGGNFGIVVSFTLKTYKVGGVDGIDPGFVYGGVVPFLPDAFDRATVIEKYGIDCLKASSDDVSLLLLACGGPCVYFSTFHGGMAAGKANLDALGKGYGASEPPKEGFGPMPWVDGVQKLTGGGNPNKEGDALAPGGHWYYTGVFCEKLTPNLSQILAKAQSEVGDQTKAPGIGGGAMGIIPVNGPYNKVDPTATAISARSANFWIIIYFGLIPPEAANGVKYGRALKKELCACEGVFSDMRLKPFDIPGLPGVDTDTHSILPGQTDGAIDKMRKIKAKYDPNNVLFYNQSLA